MINEELRKVGMKSFYTFFQTTKLQKMRGAKVGSESSKQYSSHKSSQSSQSEGDQPIEAEV